MLFFLIFMLMRLIAWCGLYDVFFFCSGESSQLTSLSIYKASLSIEMKLKHYYAPYTPVRVICWIVLKKNEITSGAVYTPCGLSPGKYGSYCLLQPLAELLYHAYLLDIYSCILPELLWCIFSNQMITKCLGFFFQEKTSN